jgi:putative nucleotidyltransferase with HDIG domain
MLTMIGIAGLAVLSYVVMQASPAVFVPALLFLGAAMLTEALPARLHNEVSLSLSVVVYITAVPYLGLVGAVAAGAGAGVVAGLGASSSRIIKGTFNTSMFILAGAGSAVVFAAAAGTSVWATGGVALQNAPRMTVGLLLAGLTHTLVTTCFVSLVVHLTAGLPLSQTMRQLAAEIVPLQILYVGISAIAYTLLVRVGGLSLLLLVVPLLVARQSLLTVQNRQEAFDRMVGTFVAAIQAKDGYTRGHAERVSDLSVLVAERMGLSYDERQLIRYGAILHDVGKIGVSIGVLCKAGPLTDDEFGEMKQHPEIGAEMLSDIDFLKPALAIVEHHHERLDGRGYPAGLEGDDIPLLTRIVTAVDAFDAMTSTRPYRRALPVSVAIEELTANAGSQFCPRVVEHLVAVIAEEGWELTDVPVHAIPVAETP